MAGLGMERGGPSWVGWYFGQYGRAKEWRLIAPQGEVYTPDDILEYHRATLERDYLISRCRQLEQLLSAKPAGLTPRERQILQQAATILANVGEPVLDMPGVPTLSTLQILAK